MDLLAILHQWVNDVNVRRKHWRRPKKHQAKFKLIESMGTPCTRQLAKNVVQPIHANISTALPSSTKRKNDSPECSTPKDQGIHIKRDH